MHVYNAFTACPSLYTYDIYETKGDGTCIWVQNTYNDGKNNEYHIQYMIFNGHVLQGDDI